MTASPAMVSCLIVDGNEGVQTRIHAWLQDAKVQHTQVFDGEHAVSACAQFKYDVVFMDLDTQWQSQVPTGVEAARQIRLQGLNTLTPVIACSGQESTSMEECASVGMNDFLLKPFNKQNLLTCIQKWTSQNAKQVEPLNLSVDDQQLLILADLAPPDFLVADTVQPKTARVLVVEDCSLTQHVICSLLKNLTDHITQAFDGEQAIMLCSQTAFDVIFMDIHMPKISGLQATQHLRSTSNLNVYTPIIAFTASGSLEEYSIFGVSDMLAKPFTTESLCDIFDKWTPYSKGMMDITRDMVFDEPTSGASSSLTAAEAPALGPNLGGPDLLGPLGSLQLPKISFSGPTGQSSQPASGPASPSSTYSPVPTASPPPQSVGGHAVSAVAEAAGGKFGRNGSQELGCMPASSSSRKKKKGNNVGHTVKEKMRRASIVGSCNAFRTLVPSVKDADKATVFRTSVEYMTFLRQSIAAPELERLDRTFLDMLAVRQLEMQGSKLQLSSPPSSPQMFRKDRRT